MKQGGMSLKKMSKFKYGHINKISHWTRSNTETQKRRTNAENICLIKLNLEFE